MKDFPSLAASPQKVNVFSQAFKSSYASLTSRVADLIRRQDAIERRLVRERPGSGGGGTGAGATIAALIISAEEIEPTRWLYGWIEAELVGDSNVFTPKRDGIMSTEYGQALNMYEALNQAPDGPFGYGWLKPEGTTLDFQRIPNGYPVAIHFTSIPLVMPEASEDPIQGIGGDTTKPRPFFMAPNPIVIGCEP